MKKTRQIAMRIPRRPGENTIAVDKFTTPHPDGTSSVQIRIDFGKVPIPDRHYAADAAGVAYDGTQVHVCFAQRKLGGVGLRSLIVIAMSADAIHRFVETCTAFIPENSQFMLTHGIPRIPLVQLESEPEQTVSMAANIVAVARAGREATVDFYHASAGSFHALKYRDELAIEPVIRVEIPLGILASVLDELVSLSKRIPQEIL